MHEKEKYLLQSVDNALQALDLFEKENNLTVQQIAYSLKISKSAAFRLAATLENRGFLIQKPGNKFALGMRVLLLGNLAHERIELMRYTHNFLSNLGRTLGERVQLDMWHNQYEVVLIDRSLSHSRTWLDIPFGTVRYPHMISSGLALLSEKDDIFLKEYVDYIAALPKDVCSPISYEELLSDANKARELGYAINSRQFHDNSLLCIGIPVYGFNDKAIAAISVAGPFTRMKANHDAILIAMREAAGMISTLNLNI